MIFLPHLKIIIATNIFWNKKILEKLFVPILKMDNFFLLVFLSFIRIGGTMLHSMNFWLYFGFRSPWIFFFFEAILILNLKFGKFGWGIWTRSIKTCKKFDVASQPVLFPTLGWKLRSMSDKIFSIGLPIKSIKKTIYSVGDIVGSSSFHELSREEGETSKKGSLVKITFGLIFSLWTLDFLLKK